MPTSPKYFTILLTAAGMNKGSFYHTDELDSNPPFSVPSSGSPQKGDKVAVSHPWRSTIVLLPPGSSIDNPLTMLPSGNPAVLITLGVLACEKCSSNSKALASPPAKPDCAKAKTRITSSSSARRLCIRGKE
ncbi:hypothetical protein VE04_10358 [Pseudogymnoascus sp. 24MN13]|nr:hypothetical protein VE04_10358 [Pseudogymnoascus sp. 24MN13]